ncbi:hypothetical protein QQP08_027757 [Theobroma cacao]|nr:hypothetical protein QQP08_027757 [Theobroma cacao]
MYKKKNKLLLATNPYTLYKQQGTAYDFAIHIPVKALNGCHVIMSHVSQNTLLLVSTQSNRTELYLNSNINRTW